MAAELMAYKWGGEHEHHLVWGFIIIILKGYPDTKKRELRWKKSFSKESFQAVRRCGAGKIRRVVRKKNYLCQPIEIDRFRMKETGMSMVLSNWVISPLYN